MVVSSVTGRTIMSMEDSHSIHSVPRDNDPLVRLILKGNRPIHLNSEDNHPVHLKSVVKEEYLVVETLVSEKNLSFSIFIACSEEAFCSFGNVNARKIN